MSIPSIIGMQDKSLWLKRAAGFLYWRKGKSWIFGQLFTEKRPGYILMCVKM